MLNLQPCVHLEKVKPATVVEQKFNRAGTAIAHGFSRINRRLTHLLSQLRGHNWAWGLFYYLLVTTLHGAVPLSKMDCVAETIGKYLNLHMARFNNGLLKNQLTGAKGALGFGSRQLNRIAQISLIIN